MKTQAAARTIAVDKEPTKTNYNTLESKKYHQVFVQNTSPGKAGNYQLPQKKSKQLSSVTPYEISQAFPSI